MSSMKLEICPPLAKTFSFVVKCAPSRHLILLTKVITLGELLTRLVNMCAMIQKLLLVSKRSISKV
jgi:hypothetical protein